MPLMSVTLDVSKLSGWLNAFAVCRVETRACTAEGGMRCGAVAAREGVDQRRRFAGGVGPTDCWGQGTRGAHRKHAVHVRDAGRVEAQRLVEGRRPELT